MSTQVDQRVVEMRFDNEQFEKGSKQTLSTLEKLQEKLQFRGAEKGLVNLSNASRKVDFAEMSGALDTLQVKFSALDVVVMTVLTRITNQVISTGEALVKNLSLDQVMSGWTKYAEKTGNVQTIMNATGKSIGQVNSYLDELMWYSDETSFSFAEMTSAISQATAAGGDLKKMVPMVMGIANATADAGKSGFAFQSTIRNLMQSYSAGHLQRMDWKSLQLMGTATKSLKQELINTAVELGTIKEGEVTVSNFEDTLSKKWATTAVLEKTFGKYSQMMTEAYELTQKNTGMTTSEALEQLAGKYGEIAERSALAAQQAKSFNEAIDSTKDAVSSKWMAVFETIFGGYDEAVETWTELANRLYDIFVPPIQDLEDRLNGALDSGMVQLQKLFGDNANVYAQMLEKTALATGAVTQQAIDDAGSFAKALEQGGVNAETLRGAIQKTIRDADELLTLSDDQLHAKGYTREQIETLRDQFDEVNQKIEAGVIHLGDYADKMSQLSGREHLMQSLWNIWDAIQKVLDPIAQAFHEIFAPSNSKQIYSFVEGMDNLTAKLILSDESAEKIKTTFKGFFSVLKIGTTTLSKIWKIGSKILSGLMTGLKPLGTGLMNAASGLGECLTGIQESITNGGSLQEVLDGIRQSLVKLLSPLGNLKDWFKNFNPKQIFQNAIDSLKNGTGWLDQLPEKTQNILRPILKLIGEFADGTLTMAGVVGFGLTSVAVQAKKFGTQMLGSITGTLPTLEEYEVTIKNLPNKLGEAIRTFGTTFTTNFDRMKESAGEAYQPITAFFTALKDGFEAISGTDIYRFLSLIDVGLLAFTIGQLAKATKSFSDIVNNLFKGPVTKAFEAMTGSFKALTGALKSWTKQNNTKVLTGMAAAVLMLAGAMLVMNQIEPDRFAQIAVTTIALIGALAIAAKSLKPEVQQFTDGMKAMQAQVLNLGTLVGIGAALLGLAAVVKEVTTGLADLAYTIQQGDIVDHINTIVFSAGALVTVLVAFGKIIATLKNGAGAIGMSTLVGLSAALLSLGYSLKLISQSLAEIGKMDVGEALQGAGFITLLTSAIGGLAFVMKKWGSLDLQNGLGFAGFAASIWVLSQSLKALATVPTDDLYSAFGALGGLTAIMGAVAATAKVGLKSGAAMMLFAGAVTELAGAMALMSLVPADQMQDGFGMLFSLITVMTTAAVLLEKFGGISLETGGGMLLMAGALTVLAGAVALYNKVGPETMVTGLLLMFSAMVTVAGGSWVFETLIKNGTETAGAMWTLSKGMLALAAAGFVFQQVDWRGILAMIGTLVITMGGLFGAGFLAQKVPMLSKGIDLVAASLQKFGKAIKDIAIGTAILGLVSLFAGPLCTAIVNAADDIQAALISIITVICNVIVACAEPIGQALLALAKVILQDGIDLIGWIWDGGDTGNGGLKAALKDLWQNIKDGIADALAPFNNGAFQQRNVVFRTNPEYNPERVKLSDVFSFSANNADAEAAGKETGANLDKGYQKGVTENGQAVADAAGQVVEGAIQQGNTTAQIHSPSKRTTETGFWLAMGLVEGLQNGSPAVMGAMQSLSERLLNRFRDFWGIHSPSELAEDNTGYIPEGMEEAFKDKNNQKHVLDAQHQLTSKMDTQLKTDLTGLKTTAANGMQQVTNTLLGQLNKFAVDPSKLPKAFTGAVTNNGLLSGLGGTTIEDILKKNSKNILAEILPGDWEPEVETPTGSSKSKGGSSETKKTVAETIAEKYEKELKANKYLQDAAEKEKELWDATTGNAATAAEKSDKETEALAKQIELQTARVEIAQKQYDELKKDAPKDDKTKDAYATLLSEKTSLATLQNERIDKVYSELLDDYDDQADRADLLYKQWSTANDKTAKTSEKEAKNLANIQRKTEIARVKAETAKQKWEVTAQELGAASTEAKQAEEDWIRADTEHQELINEYNEATIEALKAQRDRIDTEMKAAEQRQELLEKLYSDGDLSGRQSAYESAVKEYGKDSKEARKAATQGTMSSILAVGSALRGMSKNLRKLTAQQQVYNEALQQAGGDKSNETVMTAREDLEDLRYGFVELAGEFAAAFDMDDTGQKLCMQLGNTIAKNWPEIQNGFAQVMQNVSPALKETLGNALGAAEMDGSQEAMAGVLNVIVSAVQGDWGSAIVTTLTTLMNYAGSEAGQALLTQIGSAVAGGGGIEAILSGIGPVLLEFLPVIAAVAVALAGIGYVAQTVKDQWDDTKSDFENILTGIAKGVRDLFMMASGPMGWIALYLIKKAEAAKNVATEMAKQWNDTAEAADRMDGILTSDTDYEPTVRPIFDLSNARESAEWMQSAFALEDGNFSVNGTRTAMLVDKADRENTEAKNRRAAANTVPEQDNRDVVDAVTSLGRRIDDLGAKMSNLKVVMNSKKLVGEIKGDMNTALAKG